MAFSLSTKFHYEIALPEGSFTVVYKTLSAKDLEAHDTLMAQWSEQNPNSKTLMFYPLYLPQVIVKFIGFEIDETPVDFQGIEDKEEFLRNLPAGILANLFAGFWAQVKPGDDTKKKSNDTSNG